MVSAYGREEVMKKAEAVGVDAFLVKPVNPSVLISTIMSLFGGEKIIRRGGHLSDEKDLDTKIIRGARILLVEDNEINQRVALGFLESEGLEITVAKNGAEAVEAVRESRFDSVLMDIQMPEMDGFEATRIIRDELKIDDIPIIAMTAHTLAEDKHRFKHSGLSGHILKPFNHYSLFSTLIQHIAPDGGGSAILQGSSKEKSIDHGKDQGVSLKDGLAGVKNNETLYNELLQKFIQSTGNFLERLNGFLEQGDVEAALHLAHTVKGTGGLLGARELSATSSQIEQDLDSGESGRIKELVEHFQTAFEKLVREADAFRERIEVQKSTDESVASLQSPPSHKVISIVNELLSCLESDLDRALSLVEALKPCLTDFPLESEFKMFQRNMEEFETEKALENLSSIAKYLGGGPSSSTGPSATIHMNIHRMARLLKELAQCLETDLNKATGLIEKLEEASKGSPLQSEVVLLKQDMREFEPDKAWRRINLLMDLIGSDLSKE
jgi:CheY-like chemotaxis protein